jgi:hypothetical protein
MVSKAAPQAGDTRSIPVQELFHPGLIIFVLTYESKLWAVFFSAA